MDNIWRIAVICNNWRNRSKFIQKILREKWYNDVSAIGISPPSPETEIVRVLKVSDIFIVTGSDIKAMLEKRLKNLNLYMEKKIIEVYITNTEHSIIHDKIKSKYPEIKERIKEVLTSKGF